MPVPSPRSNEERSKFISRCIETMQHRDPDRPDDQIKAMCYTKWRRAKGQKAEEALPMLGRMAFFDEGADEFSRLGGAGFYKKQVLRFGTWRHPEESDMEFDITPDVAREIVENFNAGIPDEAPVVLTHTQNPREKVGRVQWFDFDENGIYAVLSVSDEDMRKKIEDEETSPGVSVWLDLDYQHKETGKDLGAVIKHVALVNNPYIERLSGFEQVDFSEESKGFMPLLLSESKNFNIGEAFMKKKKDEKNEITKEAAIQYLKENEEIDVDALLSERKELVELHDKIDKGELINKEDSEDLISEELINKVKKEMKLSDEDVKDKKTEDVIKEVLSKHAKLSETVKSLTGQLATMEAEKRVDKMLSDGYALPTEKEVLKKLYLSDKDLFEGMEEARRKNKPMIKLGEEGVQTPDEIEADEKAKEEEQKLIERNLEAAKAEGYIFDKK